MSVLFVCLFVLLAFRVLKSWQPKCPAYCTLLPAHGTREAEQEQRKKWRPCPWWVMDHGHATRSSASRNAEAAADTISCEATAGAALGR